jgi:hypothetical protein
MNEVTSVRVRISPCLEPLETRTLFSAGAAPVSVQSVPPPGVYSSYVSGTDWTPAFRQAVEAANRGTRDLGYGSIGPDQNPVPWINVNQLTVRFSQDMVVEARHLHVLGTTGEYPIASFSYRVDPLNFNGIATWTLARPLVADNILLVLDAHSPDGVRVPDSDVLLDGDRDGHAGGDYRFRFRSLPVSLSGNSRVTVGDLLSVRARYGRSTENPGTGPTSYSLRCDVTADGRMDARDLAEVRRRIGDSVPAWQPTAAAVVSQPAASSRARPVTRAVFGSEPILC